MSLRSLAQRVRNRSEDVVLDATVRGDEPRSRVPSESVEPLEPEVHPGWIRLHAWPLLGMAAVLISGMAFSFFWIPVVHHAPLWFTPSDLWGTYRSAQYVTWGGEGQIYAGHAYFDTFPGIAIFLAPVAKMASVFHMSEAFPVFLARPTSWFLLGPANLISGSVLLFPLDTLARRLSVPTKRRLLIVFVEAALIWPVVSIWGHPEVTLALAFSVYGLMAAFDGSWVRVGGSFALAIVIQPLTLLILPIALAYIPVRKWPLLSGTIALPSALLLLPPLIQQWKPTTYTLLKQPMYLYFNHATPWLSLAPVLKASRVTVVMVSKTVKHANGNSSIVTTPTKVFDPAVVGAGPGRMIALVLAVAIGVWVAKAKPSIPHVVWLAAIALSLRCLFEPVMIPYYLVPGLALGLVVAAKTSRLRLGLTVIGAGACTWLSNRHLSPWTYYVVVMCLVFLALALARPKGVDPSESWIPRRRSRYVAPSAEFAP
jgi:hypothetical protein